MAPFSGSLTSRQNESARGHRSPFVGEIALTRDGKAKFPAIAEQYLLGTGGRIRTFSGLDIEYRDPKSREYNNVPRWEVWYPWRFDTKQVVENGTRLHVGVVAAGHGGKGIGFHDARGIVNPISTISLALCDFYPRRKSDNTGLTIEITHQELSDALARAELVQRSTDAALTPPLGVNSDDTLRPVRIRLNTSASVLPTGS